MDERTVARFLSKVDKNGPIPARRPDLGPCWLWKPPGAAGGYGQFSINGKPQGAHRASYEMFVKAIPPGLTIDHLCFVRPCVNPAHLELATLGENVRRARAWEGGAAFQRDKTHCPYGHPYSGDNLRIAKDGSRSCRECDRRHSSDHRARKLAANPPVPKPPREFCAQGHPFAEFGEMRGGKRICGECSRERTRQYRERRRAEQEPKAAKVACKHGHPWTEDNIYVDPRGHKHCRTCHNERTLERYHAVRAARPGKPPREACANGHRLTQDNIYVTPGGEMKCRQCARERNHRYSEKLAASRAPKPERTHCPRGHELAGDNLYVAPNGRKFCRTCMAMYQERHRAGASERNPAKGRRPKQFCPHGHEMTAENTYIPPSGGRKCRECIRKKTREFMRAKRAAVKAAGQGSPVLF